MLDIIVNALTVLFDAGITALKFPFSVAQDLSSALF